MRADPEDEVIRILRAASPPPPPGVIGIGDDAALVPRAPTLWTTDTMVEGRHWDTRLSPQDVGWKLVAVNVSDIAAMGGRPSVALLALTLPRPLDLEWVRAFAAGLGAALWRWRVPLVGGDTTGGDQRVASLTVGGGARSPVRRSGGRPGDLLFVSGELGRSAEGLLASHPRPHATAWLRRPRPPTELGARLGEAGRVTAMMDLSDGLARDLPRLCESSACGALIDPLTLPGDAPLPWKLGFGEDYELLFAAHPSARDAIVAIAMDLAVPLTCIGALEGGHVPRLADGAPWPEPLDSHFPGANP